jgi:cytochrome c biogenesis protein CcdA
MFSDWPTKRTFNSLCRLISRDVSFEAKKKQVTSFLKNTAFSINVISLSLLTCILSKILNSSGYIPVIIDWVTKNNWALLGAALSSHLGRALVFNEVLCLQKDLTLNQDL